MEKYNSLKVFLNNIDSIILHLSKVGRRNNFSLLMPNNIEQKLHFLTIMLNREERKNICEHLINDIIDLIIESFNYGNDNLFYDKNSFYTDIKKTYHIVDETNDIYNLFLFIAKSLSYDLSKVIIKPIYFFILWSHSTRPFDIYITANEIYKQKIKQLLK